MPEAVFSNVHPVLEDEIHKQRLVHLTSSARKGAFLYYRVPHKQAGKFRFTLRILHTVAWPRGNTPDFIEPNEWPSKSPDLNVMDFAMWGLLLHQPQLQRSEVTHIQSLKTLLVEAWNNILLEAIQRATGSWLGRLHRCAANTTSNTCVFVLFQQYFC